VTDLCPIPGPPETHPFGRHLALVVNGCGDPALAREMAKKEYETMNQPVESPSVGRADALRIGRQSYTRLLARMEETKRLLLRALERNLPPTWVFPRVVPVHNPNRSDHLYAISIHYPEGGLTWFSYTESLVPDAARFSMPVSRLDVHSIASLLEWSRPEVEPEGPACGTSGA
jgi:hypothetical protein